MGRSGILSEDNEQAGACLRTGRLQNLEWHVETERQLDHALTQGNLLMISSGASPKG